ncbi:MAG: NAAT family transporter [Methanophagales archaeon]|nr:NAAT family transporter [Methanophagales archaeon]MCW3141121.1 NAAT family transporter [Methanophagales archaeon]
MYIGLDVHKKSSFYAMVDETGEEKERFPTTYEGLDEFASDLPEGAKIFEHRKIKDIIMDGWLLVKAFIMLFVIMDPAGNIPVFMALTKGMSGSGRKKELNYAVLVATILLLLFAFLGKIILYVLGITTYSFMVAGGILLLFFSLDLLRGEHKYVASGGSGAGMGVGAVPLGTPLLAGPGAITTVMVIIQSWGAFVVLFAIFSAILATMFLLGLSDRIYRILGKVGSEVLSRIMGIIVAAIAIEFIAGGIRGMFF